MSRPRDEVRRLRAEVARLTAERDAARLVNAELRELAARQAGIINDPRRADALANLAQAHYQRGLSDCQEEAAREQPGGQLPGQWGRLTLVPAAQEAVEPGTLRIVAENEPLTRAGEEWQICPLSPEATTMEYSQPAALSCDIEAEAG